MKKIIIYFALGLLLTGLNSCDKDFEQINVNPTQATALDPLYLFANAQFTSALNVINYPNAIVQQQINSFTGVIEGGNHNVYYDDNSRTIFNTMYTATSGPVVLLTSVLDQLKTNTSRSNLYNMARIWKAYCFMVLVDSYGDVPYTEAGKGFLENIGRPKYDDQKVIYADILKELEEASKALDASKPTESEIFYAGNIVQWKKLGFSLLLRAGMRYTKFDAAKAQAAVTAAVAGGVMTSNADNAYIKFNASFNHPLNNIYNGTEKANYYLGQPFVDYLKNTSDPRLQFFSVKYQNPDKDLSGVGTENSIPAEQIGMPFGYTNANITTAPGFPGAAGAGYKYSQLNRRLFGTATAPEFFITHAQTQLLLAEAAQRGWTSGSAATFYNTGVRAHMEQLKQWDASAAIPVAAQDAYLATPGVAFDATKALEQINTQYWIASFLNGSEAWANFRRSGFPALTPNPFPSPTPPLVVGNFIHRLQYPAREKSANTENYNAAVARQGADNLATRVFWDK